MEEEGFDIGFREIKPVFSREIENKILKAGVKKDGKKSYSYDDIINLQDEIDYWETVNKEHPGLYSLGFIKNQLKIKRSSYNRLISAEKTAFRNAIKNRNVNKVYYGVMRRLSDRMVYDLTDKLSVVKCVLDGETIEYIASNQPEILPEDIQLIMDIIERGEYA